MAVSTQDHQLLSTCPHPPSGLASSPTPTRSVRALPSPRPSDFGHIHLGLFPEEGTGSLYDHDISLAPAQVSVPISNPGELQLVLDDPFKLYTPDETITGYISRWNHSSEPSQHIYIVLEGRAKTYMHTKSHRASRLCASTLSGNPSEIRKPKHRPQILYQYLRDISQWANHAE